MGRSRFWCLEFPYDIAIWVCKVSDGLRLLHTNVVQRYFKIESLAFAKVSAHIVHIFSHGSIPAEPYSDRWQWIGKLCILLDDCARAPCAVLI